MTIRNYYNSSDNKYLYNPEKLRFFEPIAFRACLPARQGSSKNHANQRFAVFRDGKELQDDLGLDWPRQTGISDKQAFRYGAFVSSQKTVSCLYDYGASFYDASLGRWYYPFEPEIQERELKQSVGLILHSFNNLFL